MRESENAEVLGMAFMSHQGSLGCTVCGGGWRQVAKLQIFFSKIFCLKVFNHLAVINTSFSRQVVSISSEPRKKSFLLSIFPKENLC